jgi:hypothetical protein
MYHSSLRRGNRATALAFLVLAEDLKDQLARCGEVMPSPGADPSSPGESPPQESVWHPRAPDRNSMCSWLDTDPFMLGVTEHWELPSEEPGADS